MDFLGIFIIIALVAGVFYFVYWAIQRTLKDGKRSRRKRTRSRR